MSAARLHLVECRQILGGERDPFRAVWDEQATQKDRRLLLMMAGETAGGAGYRSALSWCDLSAHTRGEVVRKMKRFGEWAERLK